ncbi:MAG TPA: copper chaperone PCu(A)C [Jatrophihabitans sp.]|nr:copper chaperone PCu(A)C [Jatrophihabitans sp.]
MRLPWPAVTGGLLAVAVGAAGLIRAAVPEPASAPASPSGPGAVTVVNAYVRAPIPPHADVAAAYFTVYNTTGRVDRIVRVLAGAGAAATLHTDVGGHMQLVRHGVAVPAHGKLVLAPGGVHVMIEHLFGELPAGEQVNLEVDFARAGPLDVVAKVIPYGAKPPS